MSLTLSGSFRGGGRITHAYHERRSHGQLPALAGGDISTLEKGDITTLGQHSDLARDLARALAHAKGLDLVPLYQVLTALTLPTEDTSEEDWDAFAAQLQVITTEHRDIGHDWNFTEEQAKTLGDY